MEVRNANSDCCVSWWTVAEAVEVGWSVGVVVFAPQDTGSLVVKCGVAPENFDFGCIAFFLVFLRLTLDHLSGSSMVSGGRSSVCGCGSECGCGSGVDMVVVCLFLLGLRLLWWCVWGDGGVAVSCCSCVLVSANTWIR